MKKYIVLILGILLLIISFIWMILSETSTGPFLVLSEISGATIAEGIHQVRKMVIESNIRFEFGGLNYVE